MAVVIVSTDSYHRIGSKTFPRLLSCADTYTVNCWMLIWQVPSIWQVLSVRNQFTAELAIQACTAPEAQMSIGNWRHHRSVAQEAPVTAGWLVVPVFETQHSFLLLNVTHIPHATDEAAVTGFERQRAELSRFHGTPVAKYHRLAVSGVMAVTWVLKDVVPAAQLL